MIINMGHKCNVKRSSKIFVIPVWSPEVDIVEILDFAGWKNLARKLLKLERDSQILSDSVDVNSNAYSEGDLIRSQFDSRYAL